LFVRSRNSKGGSRKQASPRRRPRAIAKTGGNAGESGKPDDDGHGSSKRWPADDVERWTLDRLKPSARNARTHGRKQVAQLVESIREFGFPTPILVDEAGEIIAGHGRLAAARKLKLPDVPVMVARGWTEPQIRAYRIADNKLALNAGWDVGALAGELSSLDGMGVDLALTGFGPDEIAALQSSSTGDDAGDKAPRAEGEAIISYAVVFDDDAQRQAWFEHMRALRTRFPDAETVGQRLTAWIAERL
jgi:hypothetical protein